MVVTPRSNCLIKQRIQKDDNPATIWERDRTVCFNVSVLNSDMFRQVTGKPPPSTPVSAKTYRDRNLPFYEICRENPTSKDDFDDIESVKQLDTITNENGKWGHEGGGAPRLNKKATGSSVGADEDGAEDDADEDEQPLEKPIILLKPNGSVKSKFVPVSELMDELCRIENSRKTQNLDDRGKRMLNGV